MGKIGASRRRDLVFTYAVVLICGLGTVWALLGRAALQRRTLAHRLDRLNSEVRDLGSQRQAYLARRDALKSDPIAIEQEARKQLSYARPGEERYPIPGTLTIHTPEPSVAPGAGRLSDFLARNWGFALEVALTAAIVVLLIALLRSVPRSESAS